ncbi:glycine-rich RNA-binding protein 4, mitochondrial isoform X3 [Exaiptasia diaphana]|uniref:RRM domain-containing protein n=1 Tax=Exaiptasia diaphana TaxID=2652724 RepID=A0A913X5R6_EXADI|nr:glycine-rich RNA-binding protein 4, mitochondrial isoform X3 [Exaiptasia diaphana]
MDHYTETSELELENFFAEYGAITDVRIVCDKHTGVSKGFGFVTYETPESRDSVLIKDKIDYNGRQLRLRLAIRRKGHGQFVTEVTDYGSPNGYGVQWVLVPNDYKDYSMVYYPQYSYGTYGYSGYMAPLQEGGVTYFYM